MTHSKPISFLLTAIFASCSLLLTANAQMADQIKAALAGKEPELQQFYQKRNYQPVWDAARLQGLASFINSLDRHGLDPELFNFASWQTYWAGGYSAQMDVETTHLANFAIQALAYGFVAPNKVHPKWKEVPRSIPASDFLSAALNQPPHTFSNFLLAKAPPQDPKYINMVKKLSEYRQIQAVGGWKAIPNPRRPIYAGISYPDLNLLKARLKAEGDLPETPPVKNKKNIVEKLTSDALKSFQFRHGIDVDGALGPSTLKELNHPVKDRIDALIINLDRIRWMPRAYEQAERIEVNIAESALRVYNTRGWQSTMEVIVGVKGKHQTPVFRGDIKFLTFRPYWNVPNKIAKNEEIPSAFKKGYQEYFSKNDYEIVPYFGVGQDKVLPVTEENLHKVAAGKLHMRQGTGPTNALGLVKFIFPNDNAVYLHDTPNHSLFQKADRDLSHGCVRVSRPDRLAQMVLRPNRDENWTLAKVQQTMQDEANPAKKVNLEQPLPVYLMYWTAYIMNDKQQRVRFDQDIYGHDIVMKQLLGLQ